MRETPSYPFFERSESRRSFFKDALAWTAGGSVVAVTVVLGWRAYDMENPVTQGLYGEQLPGTGERDYKADPSTDENFIYAKSKLSRANLGSLIVSFLPKGSTIQKAIQVYGPVYPSGALGNFPGPDGERYGTWYRAEVEVYRREKNGALVPVFDENGARVKKTGYIVGSDLVRADRAR